MAYIDPDGMFYGDRMSLLSDEAKLYWPYFWCASNSVGRIELNYRKVIAKAFSHFILPPTEEQFWNWAREYRDCFLLFIYKHEGQVWGQWDVSERYLPDHKLANDRRTPAPNGTDLSDWKNQYVGQKIAKSDNPIVANNSGQKKQNKKMPVERRGEERRGINKTFPAESAGGEAGSTTGKDDGALFEIGGMQKPKPLEEQWADLYAPRLYARHPKRRRDLGVNGVRKAFLTILSKAKASERSELAEQIDRNHEAWCKSEGWTKDDGEFAKSLENWLSPTKCRWEVSPPAQAELRDPAFAPVPKFLGHKVTSD